MRLRTLAPIVLACAVMAGCGSGSGGGDNVLVGPVIEIDSRGIGEVRGFQMRDGGATHRVFLDPEATYDFPPDHLIEHLATGQPVRVEYERRGGRIVAVTLGDA
jgi:hypothetical protein